MKDKAAILQQLRREIISLGGIKSPQSETTFKNGLGFISKHFPLHVFPSAAVHEFLSPTAEQQVAASAFIAATIVSCLPDNALIVWINNREPVFAPSLIKFGLQPHKIIFVNPANEKETNWCVEEALRCANITAVVAEMKELNFTNSRRFQLAVEQSKVTGFIVNTSLKKMNTTACVSRWQIISMPSETTDGMPGIGYPRWKVELQKMRNGKPGYWDIEWVNGKFAEVYKQQVFIPERQVKTG